MGYRRRGRGRKRRAVRRRRIYRKRRAVRRRRPGPYHAFVGLRRRGYGVFGGSTVKAILPGIMPQMAAVRFRICGQLDLDTTTAPTVVSHLTPTNPLDPFNGSSTEQMRGWDQWVAFYNSFRCTSATVTAVFWRNEALATMKEDVVFGLIPDAEEDAVLAANGFGLWCQWPRVVYTLSPAEAVIAGTPADQFMLKSSKKHVLKLKLNPETFFRTDMKGGRYDLLTSGTNAANLVHVQLLVGTTDSTNFTAVTKAFSCMVYISLTGFFFDRKRLTVS